MMTPDQIFTQLIKIPLRMTGHLQGRLILNNVCIILVDEFPMCQEMDLVPVSFLILPVSCRSKGFVYRGLLFTFPRFKDILNGPANTLSLLRIKGAPRK